MPRKHVVSWDNRRSEAAQCANTERPLANQLDYSERQAALSMASQDELPTPEGAK